MTGTDTQQHAAVVYHPGKTNLEQLQQVVAIAETAAGWGATRWYETEAADAGAGATERAVQEGAAVVLASGGDGTVRAVAATLSEVAAEVPLTIVPQGTGNVLARNIGVPLGDLGATVAAAFGGERRKIDLGSAVITAPDGSTSTGKFLVLAGVGIDARLIAATKPALKKALGWVAYIDAAMRSMFGGDPVKARVEFDGEVGEVNAYSIMIGNCGVLPGGLVLIPDARINDGSLDVVMLMQEAHLGALSWGRIARRIFVENKLLRLMKVPWAKRNQTVVYRRIKKLTIAPEMPESVQLDGDDFGEATRLELEVLPAALELCVLPEWMPQPGVFSASNTSA